MAYNETSDPEALKKSMEDMVMNPLKLVTNITNHTIQNAKLKDKTKEMMMRFVDRVNSGEYPVVYKVSQSRTKELMDLLEAQNIPYYMIDTKQHDGDTIFMVSEKDQEAFFEILQSFEMTNLNFYKDCDVLTMMNSVKGVYEETFIYNYEDEVAADIAVQKAYNAGIAVAKEKNDDGSYSVVFHPNSIYNTHDGEKGLLRFELAMAKENAKNNIIADEIKGTTDLDLRIKQAEWDNAQFEKFAENVLKGKECTFEDYEGKSDCFIEFKNNNLYVKEFKNGMWTDQVMSGINDCKDKETIKKLCSAYAERIKNNTCIDNKELRDAVEEFRKDITNTTKRQELGEIITDKNGKVMDCRDKSNSDQLYSGYDDELKEILKEAKEACRKKYPDVKISNVGVIKDAIKFEKEYVIGALRREAEKDVDGYHKDWLNNIADSLEGKGKETILTPVKSGTDSIKSIINNFTKITEKEAGKEEEKEAGTEKE